MEKKIIIIGSGPTGLGAAWRLQELNYNNFKVFEQKTYPGGLAASFKDEKGFTWDVGGHVLFSHYKYFDDLMNHLLKNEWLYHERESWVWIKNRFVPYPFQNNIKYLQKEDIDKCLKGLEELQDKTNSNQKNFEGWILSIFGKGIAELFMIPYNYKVWAFVPNKMSFDWIDDRVSVIDLKRIKDNIKNNKDDVSWGPNNTFRFPLKGGTGEIWRRLYNNLNSKKVFFNHQLIKINTKDKIITFSNGHNEKYDYLISTMPLDKLVLMSDLEDKSSATKLLHSSVHIIGLGLKGNPKKHLRKKCWMYFPEDDCPFYRVTVFSNYSPNNVPNISKYWSLMLEVSESSDKKVNHKTIKEDVIQGALNTKLIESKKDIVDFWYHFEPYGYPTPSLERDQALAVLKVLDKLDVHSRGRFGAWKYEVSNQDHSMMQGVEIINRLLLNEKEITVWDPKSVNKKT